MTRLRCGQVSLRRNGPNASRPRCQALSALLLLYREVLKSDLPWLDGLTRPSNQPRDTRELGEQCPDLLFGEHDRQPNRLLLVEPLRLWHWIASTASREGVQVYDVPAAYSPRTCSAGGDVSVAKSAELEVVCGSCGVIQDRDENAARRAPRWLEKQLQDARAQRSVKRSSINGLTGVP